MDQPNLNTRQRRWPDVVNGCDYEILYHMGKAHMVADSWTRRVVNTLIQDVYLRMTVVFTVVD